VVDEAHLLSPEQAAALDARLAALEQQSQRQMVIATIPSLEGYDIEDYGYRLGRAWGIGDKQRNDGLLLIVAPNDRQVSIEVGYGLEGIVSDAVASEIRRNEIVPHFKAGDYAGGIIAATDKLVTQLQLPEDEARKVAANAEQRQRKAKEPRFDFGTVVFLVIFFLFFVLPFLRALRGGGRRYGAPGVMIFPTGGWGSGGSDGAAVAGPTGAVAAAFRAAAAASAAAVRQGVGEMLSEQDRKRIAEAVAAAEARSAGEIVTIVTPQSDPDRDARARMEHLDRLPRACGAGIGAELLPRPDRARAGPVGPRMDAPAGARDRADRRGTQVPRHAADHGWRPLRLALTPTPIKAARVHARALTCFRIGAEGRTTGRTGILIYLSLAEHRAEIIADEAIASKVAPEVWVMP
jgi:uncharacterized protein